MKKRGVPTIGITNNEDSVVAKECLYHIQTSTREKLFLNEFCFSRISVAPSQCEELYASLKV